MTISCPVFISSLEMLFSTSELLATMTWSILLGVYRAVRILAPESNSEMWRKYIIEMNVSSPKTVGSIW